jgi:hypothetical protein
VTPEIEVSIWVDPPQHRWTLPAEAWILIAEHVTGLKLMLQPFDIGEPVHVLPTVSSVPTFVASQ